MKIIARRNFAFYFIIGKIKNIAGFHDAMVVMISIIGIIMMVRMFVIEIPVLFAAFHDKARYPMMMVMGNNRKGE
ncbi:MAG: hypothetical protein EZS26_002981 [Candidatus Ordinivivax streblomastigis]|uniref:Uncharacterized protein n=2 Tax=root TaxID=1 RepID=A0A5M8NUV4_9BACT|nr:MAG: hypothetical protein EZS26_002981 [Candidatus Ordinivivax streblomastigis]